MDPPQPIQSSAFPTLHPCSRTPLLAFPNLSLSCVRRVTCHRTSSGKGRHKITFGGSSDVAPFLHRKSTMAPKSALGKRRGLADEASTADARSSKTARTDLEDTQHILAGASVLMEIVLQEHFDARAAEFIIYEMTVETMPQDLFIREDCDMAKLHKTTDRAELLQILKRRVREWADNYGVVTYRHGKHWAKAKLGRLQADNGFQGFPRQIRAMLAIALYWDVDCANAQPSILLQLARAKKWLLWKECPNLERYVAERACVLHELQAELCMSKDEVKQAIIAIQFGGREKKQHAFLTGLREEMEILRDFAWKEYEHLHALAQAKHADKCRRGQPSAGPKAILLATVLQTEECRVLMALVDAARRDGCSFHSLIHDGALLWKEDCPDIDRLRGFLLPRWERAIHDQTGYSMTLAVKPMVQVSVPPKPVDRQQEERDRCAQAESVLQSSLRSSKRFSDVALCPVRGITRSFLASANGECYCGTAKDKHKHGVFFRMTHFAVYQECSDRACHRRRHLIAKLTPEQSQSLFPHAKLDALTEALDTVRVKKDDVATMKAYERAASGYLMAAQRYGVLDRARELLFIRLGFFGVDVERFKAVFQVCEPAALWAEVYRAAPTRVSRLLMDLEGQDSGADAVHKLTACDAPADCRLIRINKPYLDESDLHDVEVLQVKSAMGTAKSSGVLVPAMRNVVKRNGSVLLVSPRISFTTSIADDLVKDGFCVEVYRDAHCDMLAPGQVSIISPQSLYRLGASDLLGLMKPKRCSLLVLDECETTLAQMSPNPTQRNHLISNWQQLIRLIQESKHVVAADAYLSNRTTSFLASVRPSVSSCLVVNEYRPEKGTALKIVGNVDHVRASFKEHLLQSVQAGKRVYVLCTERKFNDELKGYLTAAGVNVVQHTSENRNAASLGDVEASWAPPVQVVLCTLCVSVGVNYDPSQEAYRFDQVFAYCNVNCGLVRDVLQGLMRARKLRERMPALLYAVNIGFGACKDLDVAGDMLRKRQQLRAMAHTQTFAALNHFCQWVEAPEAVKQVDVANEIETMTCQAYYEDALDSLLQETGFVLREEFVDDSFVDAVPQVEQVEEDVAWKDIPELSTERYEHLRHTMSEGARALSNEEQLAIQKHLFLNCCVADASDADKELAWSKAVQGRKLSQQFWNLVAEGKGVQAAIASAAMAVYAHQKSMADKHAVVSALLQVLTVPSTIEDEAEIPAERIAATLQYLKLHEAELDLLFGLKPSAREEKDMAWARSRVNSILNDWSGSTLKTVRKGKKGRHITWVLHAELAAVGKAVGVGGPKAVQSRTRKSKIYVDF